MKKLLFSAPLCFLLISCNGGTTNNPNTVAPDNTKYLNAAPIDGWVKLGLGIFSPTGVPGAAICLKDGSNVSYTNGTGHLSLSSNVTQSQLQSYFNQSIDGKVGWSIFSTSASSNFIRETQDDQYSRNFKYLQDFGWNASIMPQYYGTDNLTPAALSAYNKSPADFINFCGDSFLNSAYAGVILGVNVKIHFNSNVDKQKFDNSFGAGALGFGSLTSAIKASPVYSSMNAIIDVEAVQIGGMPDKLANIFKASKEGFYVSSCSFKTINDCDQIINGVIGYAQSLSQQVRDGNGKIVPENLTYYNPSTEKYTDLGIDLTTPIPSRDIVVAQTDLQTLYNDTSKYQTFVNHYINSTLMSRFNLDFLNFLKQQQSALGLRMAWLNSHGYDCYTSRNISNCPKILSDTRSTFSTIHEYSIDETKLDYVLHGWKYTNSGGVLNYLGPISFSGALYGFMVDQSGSGSISIQRSNSNTIVWSINDVAAGYTANGVATSSIENVYVGDGKWCLSSGACGTFKAQFNYINNPF
ncbi:MAG: hypothetical protein K2X04_03935 [Burkholderiales bacterium]|nr:hypothetical protein [Burkholderiales bacterium]